MKTVAALFVETGGCYYGLPDVDPWDEARDARKYTGPWPVVAHPPCARWGNFPWHRSIATHQVEQLSAGRRARTPIEFRDVLLGIARTAVPARAA